MNEPKGLAKVQQEFDDELDERGLPKPRLSHEEMLARGADILKAMSGRRQGEVQH